MVIPRIIDVKTKLITEPVKAASLNINIPRASVDGRKSLTPTNNNITAVINTKIEDT